MDSRSSEAKHPTPVETKTGIPKVPQEIIDEILGHLTTNLEDPHLRSLQSCALVSKSWVHSCRRHLFHTILFHPREITRWLTAFPVLEESPAHYVRNLYISIYGHDSVPGKFFEHTPWFTNVESVFLFGHGGYGVTPVQLRDIMMQMPNLDNLSLSGSLAAMDRRALLGIETVSRGRLGGKLQLLNGFADERVMDPLSKAPTRLYFTEVQICGTHERLLPTVRLAEACSNTLVKLSYTVSFHYGGTFERSFDFSKLPNLQEVDLGVGWMAGALSWIPVALSTIKPATSPRLSVIQLNFVRPPVANRSVQAMIESTANNLQSVAHEVTRIEREFEGAVDLTVHRNPGFKVAFDTLNILQRSAPIPPAPEHRILHSRNLW